MSSPSAPRALLEAVRILHERGYERLRVYPYLYGTGHWRCELSIVGQPLRAGERLLHYSSASNWRFTREDADEPRAPEQIADRLQAIAGLERTRLACPPYRVWFRVLLQHSSQLAGPDALPYHADEYFDAVREGCVRFSGPGGRGEFPLAPVY